jgi:hypothetical protein
VRSDRDNAQLQRQLVWTTLFFVYCAANMPVTDTDAMHHSADCVIMCQTVLQPFMQQIRPPTQQPAARPPSRQQRQQLVHNKLQVLEECLGHLPGMLERLLAAMHAHMPGSSTTGGSCTGSSCSNNLSGSSSSSGMHTRFVDWESTTLGMAHLAQLSSMLLGAAGGWLPYSTSVAFSSREEFQAHTAAAARANEYLEPAEQLWKPHALQVTAVLEALTRAAAGAAAAGKASPLMQQFYDAAGVQREQARYWEAVLSSTCRLCIAANHAGSGVLLQVNYLAVLAGAQGKEQLQLLGLACSMLKYHVAFADSQLLQDPFLPLQAVDGTAAVGGSLAGLDNTPPVADKLAMVAYCATEMLVAVEMTLKATAPSKATGSSRRAARRSGKLKQPVAAAAVAAAAQGVGTFAVLPWLMLLGRCCMIWANKLQHLGPWIKGTLGPGAWPAGLPASTGRAVPSAVWLVRRQEKEHSMLHRLFATFKLWWEAGTVASEVTAAGYDLQPLQGKVDSTVKAVHAFWDRPTGKNEHTQLVSCLQALAEGFCAVAAPAICNNPRCSNVSGPSETEMVSGCSSLCGGCCVAHYCSRVCQRQHWKQHERVCQTLAAAAAAGAKAAAGPTAGGAAGAKTGAGAAAASSSG